MADKCCRYMKYGVCLAAALLIVYLIMSFIGGIDGKNYLPKQHIITSSSTTSHATGSDPFETWTECDSSEIEPSILAYHIHGVFDGNDQESINVAINAYHSFINTFDKDMKQCTFSHSNSGNYQQNICFFPRNFEDTVKSTQ